VFPGFSLLLDTRGVVGGLGGRVRSACEEFEDNEGGVFNIGLMFLRVVVPAHPGCHR